MPAGLSRAAAATAFVDAVNNITTSFNDCGLADQVSARSKDAGTSTRESDLSTTGACARNNGVSIWDAGKLPKGYLAMSCSWWQTRAQGGKALVAGDVRFSIVDYRWTNNPTKSCCNAYDIRSLGTHEAGHVFGLGHVYAMSTPVYAGHSNLTRDTSTRARSKAFRTLGLGDVLGLLQLY